MGATRCTVANSCYACRHTLNSQSPSDAYLLCGALGVKLTQALKPVVRRDALHGCGDLAQLPLPQLQLLPQVSALHVGEDSDLNVLHRQHRSARMLDADFLMLFAVRWPGALLHGRIRLVQLLLPQLQLLPQVSALHVSEHADLNVLDRRACQIWT